MKPTWKKSLSAAVLSVSLVLTASPAMLLAQESGAVTQSAQGHYVLTPLVGADVKSVYSERFQEGTRIGAVVRLYNEGNRVVRVPDYDLRVKTAEGVEYTLRASVANAKAIQPKEKVDLSYMLTLDYIDATGLSELSWVEVDEYVYPKLETPILTVPVNGIVWNGSDSAVTGEGALKQWAEPFKLPVLSDSLQYTPVTLINEKTPQGPVTVITLIAENTGDRTETVPDFRIDGKSDSRSYAGKRAETSVELKPGEKKYIHYGILTENNAVLNSLTVLTPETFVQLGANNTPSVESYTVGRLSVALPQASTVDVNALPVYKMKDRIAFDPLNKLIDKDTEVSLVDLTMNESESAGYNTIIAKFIVKNNGERPVPLPAFQTELTNAEGFRYSGTRQTTSVGQLAPKLSYLVNYTYAVPSSEKGGDLLMKLQDNQTIAPYNIPIAGFKTTVAENKPTNDDTLSFYPYNVKLNSWALSIQGSAMGQFSYKLKLDTDITTVDDVIADVNSANMKIELLDNSGRMIATQTMPFAGVNKLISGTQYLVFQNLRTDQFEWPLTVKLYESIQTPAGEANRLIKTMKQ
ncbi:hypothetical protein FE783_32865 [Paenibacillus mesophilus]|uniref:hypothetical protein n=1 Tax=Paenibacillus mesophilus TaxID=2582849 RepID=UPI00110D83FD|nr:hypothetical protein [Paenibacillus mesophilus]TMV44297.1 hypothetical protein FE783_32865 [Paenibacillus mesophilus]